MPCLSGCADRRHSPLAPRLSAPPALPLGHRAVGLRGCRGGGPGTRTATHSGATEHPIRGRRHDWCAERAEWRKAPRLPAPPRGSMGHIRHG